MARLSLNDKKIKRHARVRARVKGTSDRPRLSVFRGNVTCYLQVIDDVSGKTLVSATEKELKAAAKMTKTDKAKALGTLLGEKCLAAGIKAVVFDRGARQYHGRVEAVADGAREAGLQF